MPLESCMIVIDNSEYTRNGDYTPTRFQAQAQAVASVFTSKTDSNPESSVGLLAMAGKSPSLLVTPTNDIGKLLSALSRSQIGGSIDLITSVQIAQLALKHRENKNARQRVVVFAGSSIEESEEELVKLGKKLRKNNVLIDVCLFGEEGMEGESKVEKMIEAAGGGDSHLVVIPPGPLLSDAIQSSPILYDPERGPPPTGEDGEMELDPNMDPELAMAIRMSLLEAAEQANRQQTAEQGSSSAAPTSALDAATAGPSSSSATLPAGLTQPLSNANVPEPVAPGDTGTTPSSSALTTGPGQQGIAPGSIATGITAVGGTAAGSEGDEDEDMDEDEMLRRAMELSKGESGDVEMAADLEGGDDDDEDEEAAIARAIAMSLEEGKQGEDKK